MATLPSLSLIVEPKSILFFTAFMPQFVNPATPVLPQLAILFSTFLGVGIVSDLGHTLLSTTGARWMSGRLRRCRDATRPDSASRPAQS
ncbi:LysE family translocator [Modicisalibacter coralii]|uniref:LysE family translocator n=1 Tax=Modicisalibacter coralii TaxID=2304602 RepID=UPI00100BDEA9|nr:hypothetical protein [Halomonas coralii]